MLKDRGIPVLVLKFNPTVLLYENVGIDAETDTLDGAIVYLDEEFETPIVLGFRVARLLKLDVEVGEGEALEGFDGVLEVDKVGNETERVDDIRENEDVELEELVVDELLPHLQFSKRPLTSSAYDFPSTG